MKYYLVSILTEIGSIGPKRLILAVIFMSSSIIAFVSILRVLNIVIARTFGARLVPKYVTDENRLMKDKELLELKTKAVGIAIILAVSLAVNILTFFVMQRM